MTIMKKSTLESRISRLENLLSSKVKNEGLFTSIANDDAARAPFDRILVAVKKSWKTLNALLDDAKKCDQVIEDFGGDPEAGDSIYTLLSSVCGNLYTLGYSADVDYYADEEYDTDEEYDEE